MRAWMAQWFRREPSLVNTTGIQIRGAQPECSVAKFTPLRTGETGVPFRLMGPVSHAQTRGPPKPSRGGGRRARAARHGMGQTSSPPGAAGSAESNEPRRAQNGRRATRNRGGQPKRDARDSGPRPPGGPAGSLDLECGRPGPPPSCAGGQGVMGHGRQK